MDMTPKDLKKEGYDVAGTFMFDFCKKNKLKYRIEEEPIKNTKLTFKNIYVEDNPEVWVLEGVKKK